MNVFKMHFNGWLLAGIMLELTLHASRIVQAQGTTYLSNLGQPSIGSLPVGSDAWLATHFLTGNNVGGYVLNSVQLAMMDASGNPNGFAVMIYSANFGPRISPGSSLSTLNGSFNPVSGGTYTYTSPSNLKLSPSTDYFIVLTGGTVIASGAYDWSDAGANSYGPSGGWSSRGSSVSLSSDGLHWRQGAFIGPQYALNATPVPEPSSLFLLLVGGGVLIYVQNRIPHTA